MAVSKTITKSLDHNYSLELQLTETATSTANNTSTISWALVLKSGSYSFQTYRIGWNVSFNGTTISEQAWSSAEYRNLAANSSLTISSGTRTVTHNADGTMTLAASASMTISKSSISPINGSSGTGTATLSGTMALTYIQPPVVSYPVITACTAYRCLSNGTKSNSGTYLRIYATARVEGSGTLSLSYSTSREDSGLLTSGTAVVIGGGNYSVTNTYSVTVTAGDGNGNTVARTINIPTELVTFHMKEGGTAVAFSTYAEIDNTVDFGTWSPIGYVLGLEQAKATLTSTDYMDNTLEPGVYSVMSNDFPTGYPSQWAGTVRVWNTIGTAETPSSTWYYAIQQVIDTNADIYMRSIWTRYTDSSQTTTERVYGSWRKITMTTV